MQRVCGFALSSFPVLSSPYYSQQLINYIGNKRRILPFINEGIARAQARLGGGKMRVLDGFAGSGAVSRVLKAYASTLHANDMEAYAAVLNRCYLANAGELDWEELQRINAELNVLASAVAQGQGHEGFICRHYAPLDDERILADERAFYTRENALILDTLKQAIYRDVPEALQPYFLGPLIVQASIHTNTSGVFKGFHKKNGVGHFGGKGENALSRIKQRISLPLPLLSEHACEWGVYQEDINTLMQQPPLAEYDLAYFDPPYNQHPYGSNYFLLNFLASPQEEFCIQDGVSGIAQNWQRSAYNYKQAAPEALHALLEATPAKLILLSYNNEGIIPREDVLAILQRHGCVSCSTQSYNTYRGCRNLKQRALKVEELLWTLEKF